MATTFSGITSFRSIPSHDKVFFYHLQHYRQWNQNSSQRRFTVCFASSIKTTRVRKKVKSNEELRSEIMEFVSAVGFPEGYVPSMKDLSEHGRTDLANIVRRRGYKFIRELLSSSNIVDADEFVPEKITDEEHNADGICAENNFTGQDKGVHMLDEKLSSTEVSSMQNCSSDDNTYLKPDSNSCGEENKLSTLKTEIEEVGNVVDPNYSRIFSEEDDVNILTSMNEEVDDMVKDASLSTNDSEYEHYTSPDLNSGNHVKTPEESSSTSTVEATSDVRNDRDQQINDMAAIFSDSLNDVPDLESDDKDNLSVKSSFTSRKGEKVASFIQNGDLEPLEDDAHGTLNGSHAEENQGHIESQDRIKIQPRKQLEYGCNAIQNTGSTSNGSIVASEDSSHAAPVNNNRDENMRTGTADLSKDSRAEAQTARRENQVEINRLKFLLHQKELELSQLKDQIEKEKQALSVLQERAEIEINKAQKLISEKDAELHAAEESLLGLQEVEIDYFGDGHLVEVAGSFNGWQHRIEMAPQSSTIAGLVESSFRKQRCWSTLLWLYPGTYEIKFIVDGEWRTDPKKESVTRGHITNNILKVDG